MRAVEIALLALVLLVRAPATRAAEELPYAELGRCALDSGAVIEDCRVAYRALGPLADDRSNVLVFPTWYTGSTADLIDAGLIGPGALADTDRYRVIAVEAFGNGLSSSPSNSTAQPGEAFPRFTVGDMVAAQHRLLSEKLGFEHVFAVMGISMGGFQALEWAVRHPGYVQKIVSIEGTPWPTAYDLLLWQSFLQVTEIYRGDAVSLQRAGDLMARLDALTLWTPEHFAGMIEPAGLEAFLQGFAPPPSAGGLLDRRYQTFAVLGHDIRRRFDDPAAGIPAAVHADVQLIVFGRDHTVNPGPSLELARWLGAQAHVLDSPCGHMGPTGECAQREVGALVAAFLERPAGDPDPNPNQEN